MEQEKNEEEFFESVVMMLNFSLNDAYLLDTKQSKHGFLNLKSTYITKIYMDNSEENMSYLDDVKASYDPSFELARGLNLKEWEKFFKGEKCDILDYVLENVPKFNTEDKMSFVEWLEEEQGIDWNDFDENYSELMVRQIEEEYDYYLYDGLPKFVQKYI